MESVIFNSPALKCGKYYGKQSVLAQVTPLQSHISEQSVMGCNGGIASAIYRSMEKIKKGRKKKRSKTREKQFLLLFICLDNRYRTEYISSPKGTLQNA